MITYRSPFSTFQLSNDLIVVVGTSRPDRFFTYGGEIEVGNKSGCFLWVRAEKDIPDANIPVIDSELTEGKETFGKCELLAGC